MQPTKSSNKLTTKSSTGSNQPVHPPVIFDGYAAAGYRAEQLKQRVKVVRQVGRQVQIAAVLFTEDKGSLLYTDLKQQLAADLGIGYVRSEFSVTTDLSQIKTKIQQLNQDSTVTGIIIQKPWRQTWIRAQGGKDVFANRRDEREQFQAWWQQLVTQIYLSKDVDGLHPQTLAAVKAGDWKQKGLVMPATARAVLTILNIAFEKIGAGRKQQSESDQTQRQIFNTRLESAKIVIVGQSDLLGKPLFYYFKNQKINVEIIGSKGLNSRIEQGKYLKDADIIITATGRRHLITGEMLKPGVIVIDAGEPQPDVEMASTKSKASFITPVPGGVGPLTVVSLMENGVELVEKNMGGND